MYGTVMSSGRETAGTSDPKISYNSCEGSSSVGMVDAMVEELRQ